MKNQIPIYQRLQYQKIRGKFHYQMILVSINQIIGSIFKNLELIQLHYIGIQVKRLKKKHVLEQLESHGITKDINTNKKDLVKELEMVLAEETFTKISGI